MGDQILCMRKVQVDDKSMMTLTSMKYLDHFACVYEWENGAKGYHFSRQQNGTVGSYEVELFELKDLLGKERLLLLR